MPSRVDLHDLHITPPKISADAKYYVLGLMTGIFLVMIMDLIDGYPDSDTAFIGFFMRNRQLQDARSELLFIELFTVFEKETA